MVSDRLKQTFEAVSASNSDIARFAGVDTSMVSRIKSGSRKVKMNSISLSRIADGFYLYCDDKNLLPSFCALFDGNAQSGRKANTEKFIKWLFDGVQDPVTYKSKKRKQIIAVTSTRLDAIMRLTGISNVRLARAANVDSSYISRIRHGVRTPSSKTELLKRISIMLAEKAFDESLEDDVRRLISAPPELTGSPDTLAEEIYGYLTDDSSGNLTPAAEMLLDKIGSFSPDAAANLPDIPTFGSVDISPVYRGTEGLRNAVIRFLRDAAANEGAELLLYSDQSMDWLVGDSDFRLKWIALMSECARKGVRIKIIHNIDRNINEMLSAIASWLPLYMYGIIEPYYCTRQTDERFSHTMFLHKGNACISACHIRGCEQDGFYDYITSSERLEFFEKEYGELLKLCKPLVKMYSADSPDIFDNESICNVTAVRDTLSLATMPETLLSAMLDRSSLSGKQKSGVLSFYNAKRAAFIASLENGFVHELIPAFSAEDIKCGKVRSDIPEIFYTASDLGEHIENILGLMEKYASYRVCILPEMPFENIRVTIDSAHVTASRLIPPQTSFVFTHPLMLGAFEGYSARLKSTCVQDKVEVRRILSSYLTD